MAAISLHTPGRDEIFKYGIYLHRFRNKRDKLDTAFTYISPGMDASGSVNR